MSNLIDSLTLTFTCETHGTVTLSDAEVWDRPCCERAYTRRLDWECFLETLEGCVAQDKQNQIYSAKGQWAGPAYVPCSEVELLEWAFRQQAEDDEAFDAWR